jgi:hypothetical protein
MAPSTILRVDNVVINANDVVATRPDFPSLRLPISLNVDGKIDDLRRAGV